jgi:hypothetical protein
VQTTEPEHPIRAVIDTSTLVDGRRRRELQQQAALGRFIAIWSPWIVGELHRVLTWRWLDRTRDYGNANWRACSNASATMMKLLLPVFETIAPAPPYPDLWSARADPGGMPRLGGAGAPGARHVVSENTRDFPPRDEHGRHMWQGIEYVQGAEFLSILDHYGPM